MTRHIRSVGLDFVESAPLRLTFTATMTAPPAAVYRALAEETESWPDWFTSVTAAAPTPGGRTVRLSGGTRFWETVLAADPGARYAYRVDRTNAPGVRALLEDWRLTEAGRLTSVRWTVATDGTALYRTVLRLARPALWRAFRDAVGTLDRRLVPPARQAGR